jgi:hypothetical protein
MTADKYCHLHTHTVPKYSMISCKSIQSIGHYRLYENRHTVFVAGR